MTVTYPTFNNATVLSLVDDTLNEMLGYLRSTNYDADGTASPVDGELWIDSDTDQLAVYLSGWIPFRGFGAGKPVIWCDDQPEQIRLLCASTGIVAGGYDVVWPTAAGTASQGLRIASIDGNELTLEWFTPSASSLALDGLTDVDATSPNDGDVLAFSTSSGNWEASASAGGGATTLPGLTDVTITAAASGDFLRHNGTAWVDATIQAGDIPDISGTYALASHTHPLSQLTQSSATTGQFPRWNGSAWVPVNLVSGDLPASYLPLTGGTVTGATTFDDTLSVAADGSLIFVADDGDTTTILAPDSMVASYSFKLPPESYATSSEYNPTGGISTGGGLAVLAVNQTSGESLWIGVQGDGSGGRFILNGTDDPLGVAGEIRRPNLVSPVIDSFSAANHLHDGSPGESGMGGDGSNTLDLLYTADLTGGPLVPQVGGTGRTSITAGALLMGGTSGTTIPAKAFLTDNEGESYTPMVELSGTTLGAAIVWGGSAWEEGGVPATDLDDLLSGSPSTGHLAYYNGSAWTSGNTLPTLTRFTGSLEVGGASGSPTPGSVRFYEGGLIGTDNITLVAPGNITTSYTIQLPTVAAGTVGQVLKSTTATSTSVLDWGDVERVDGYGFDLSGTAGGDLIAYDGANYTPFTKGSTGQFLVSTSIGIDWVYAPGRTFSYVLNTGPIEGASNFCILPRAHVDLTLTRVDVFVAGSSSPGVSFQIDDDGSNVFSVSQSAGEGLSSFTSFADSAIAATNTVRIVVGSVSGSVSDLCFQLTFTQ